MTVSTRIEEHMQQMEDYEDLSMPYLEEEEGLIDEAGAFPIPRPPVRPMLLHMSGLYASYGTTLRPPVIPRLPEPIPRLLPTPVPPVSVEAELEEEEDLEALHPILLPFADETLCLDVDGRYPQMAASGTLRSGHRVRVHWIARLARRGRNRWLGRIWYKDGFTSAFPYTHVTIQVANSFYPWQRRATVWFTTFGRALRRGRTFRFKSRNFRPVEFEFDCAAGTTSIRSIDTHDHPNRPATLPREQLTVQRVFQRAGFDVRTSSGGNIVPISISGDNKWSDLEMHDAMQAYWSRFANRPRWAMWVFQAGRHERGPGLGGIMFDDIGPNHRQGTAIFMDSFISQPPTGDSDPSAWVKRMQFWTTCHEMGHAFNLAHSWQKELGVPRIPALQNEPEARSFMNYPDRVQGRSTAFFSDFEFRFSDQELLFMRHAPERFVRIGDAEWFDHHGFQQDDAPVDHTFMAELRLHREHPVFEFLEPVALELKLKNISPHVRLMPTHLLANLDRVTLIIKKRGQAARQFIPYAQYCLDEAGIVVQPGHAVYESILVSAGRNGWDLAEPGVYTIQAAVNVAGEELVTNELRLRVAPPQGYDDEFIAQDYFSDEVGRILYFNGSNVLNSGVTTLQHLVDCVPERTAALHAQFALANARLRPYKVLRLRENGGAIKPAHDLNGVFKMTKPDKKKSRLWMTAALTDDMDRSADTFGHIRFNEMVKEYTDCLAEQGDVDDAAKVTTEVHDVFQKRGVLKSVLTDLNKRASSYETFQEK